MKTTLPRSTKKSPAASAARSSPAPATAALPSAQSPLGRGKLVGAVVSASKVLRYLRSSPTPATVTQITRALGLNPSTCFNILSTLIEEDFVHFDAITKTYTISLGVVALAKGALEQSIELKMLQPRIQQIAHRYSIMMTVWRRTSNDRIMLVAVAESDAPVRIHGRLGTRSPLLLGAGGRVFTAYLGLEREDLRERFDKLRFARALDFETYLEQLEEVRQTGWAIDDGYVYPGTVSVAAPVMEPGGALNFCCSAVMFNGQYDPKRVNAIATELCEIGRSLGGGAASQAAFSVTPLPVVPTVPVVSVVPAVEPAVRPRRTVSKAIGTAG